MADFTGQQIENYHLIKLLGTGTFGEVYLGKNSYDPTFVAIKVLKLNTHPKALKGFLNEARTFRLHHPHIVPLLDFGIEGDTAFLVMEYAPHGTLRQRHPTGSQLTPETVLTYIIPVAAALQYAHDKRLIHRDVKPSNMLVGKNNEILLSDFGIAVMSHREDSLKTQKSTGGTAPYMAPEQIQGKPRPASDQYSLGIVVYEWLCGARPFQGPKGDIIDQHLGTLPPPLRQKNPAIPPAIEHVVLKALAKEPQERYSTIQAFAQAFKDATQQSKHTSLQVIEPAHTPPDPSPIPLTPPRQLPLEDQSTVLAASINAAIAPPLHEVVPQDLANIPTKPEAATLSPNSTNEILTRHATDRSNWRPSRRQVALGIVILTLGCSGAIAYIKPQSLPGQLARTALSQLQSAAIITITPDSQIVQNTYTFAGANTTHPVMHLVAVPTITGAAQSPSIPVTATTYDYPGTLHIIETLLIQQAHSTLGANYALVNTIQTRLLKQAIIKDMLSLSFTGKGVWVYQFSNTQKLHLAKAIVGKTVTEVEHIFAGIQGISTATITVKHGNTLPTDYKQIAIIIQPISGFKG